MSEREQALEMARQLQDHITLLVLSAPLDVVVGLVTDEIASAILQAKADALREEKDTFNMQAESQKKHYSECALLASVNSSAYGPERDMTEGIIKGLEEVVSTLAEQAAKYERAARSANAG